MYYVVQLADKMLLGGALRQSETLHLEDALLHDRLQCSDRDTTYEALEEAVARESYLTWLREQEMRTRSGQHSVEVQQHRTLLLHVSVCREYGGIGLGCVLNMFWACLSDVTYST